MKKVSLLVIHLIVLTCLGYSQTVKIGNQVWMIKNLDVDKFRNGDPITQAKTEEEWVSARENKQPVWCYYDNNPANGAKYGKLYNWYAVNDSRGLAPVGYHIPSEEDWEKFTYYLGGEAVKIKSKTGWAKNRNGTNLSGFAALPAGFRYPDGSFYGITLGGYWWSSIEEITYIIWYEDKGFKINYDQFKYFKLDEIALSVRCIKD